MADASRHTIVYTGKNTESFYDATGKMRTLKPNDPQVHLISRRTATQLLRSKDIQLKPGVSSSMLEGRPDRAPTTSVDEIGEGTSTVEETGSEDGDEIRSDQTGQADDQLGGGASGETDTGRSHPPGEAADDADKAKKAARALVDQYLSKQINFEQFNDQARAMLGDRWPGGTPKKSVIIALLTGE